MASRQFATFEVADQLFGVEVHTVQEVLSYNEYTPVPLAPPAVGGLFNLRGQVIAAVDLRVQLGLARQAMQGPVMNVILRGDGEPVSLLVDRIGEVVDLDDDDVRAAAGHAQRPDPGAGGRHVQAGRPADAGPGRQPGRRHLPSHHLMYSLVSAPVLGFDLTRLGGGSATAEVMLRALRLSVGDLPVLAERLPRRGRPRSTLGRGGERGPADAVAQGRVKDDDPAGALALVERAPIGSVDALLTCLRYDVMAWTWQGAGRDAQQSETGGRGDRAALRRRGGQLPARRAGRLDPPDARRGLGVRAAQAARRRRRSTSARTTTRSRRCWTGCARIRPNDLARLVPSAEDARRNAGGWSPAVHSASWAAYLSDRVRTAAAAQMLLVQAIDTAAIPLADRAGGVWNMLSGAVQALVVRDLLDTATAHRLLAPVVAALGPAWLG